MLYGFVIPGITDPFDRNPGTNWIDFPISVGVPLTLVWYVGMMNAINFSTASTVSWPQRSRDLESLPFVIPVLTAIRSSPGRRAFIGAALGFLPYNFNPARIILGKRVALHRLRLRDRLDHRREQDHHRDQRRRSVARLALPELDRRRR